MIELIVYDRMEHKEEMRVEYKYAWDALRDASKLRRTKSHRYQIRVVEELYNEIGSK